MFLKGSVFFYNVTSGEMLATKLTKALSMSLKHLELLERFSSRFSESTLEKWRNMVEDWDKDPSKLNPYDEPEVGEW